MMKGMRGMVLTTGCMLLASLGCESQPTGASVSGITTLQVTDTVAGTGTQAFAGRIVTVHYTGWLYSATAEGNRGTKFDSSRDRNEPYRFPLGAGQVIRGWDDGVPGMRVGGQRTLIIPPSLGYGTRGSGEVIPPNATLVFEIELLAVE